MAPTDSARRPRRHDLSAALTAARGQRGLVALLMALAAAGWWWTARTMRGMDDGPWTALGALGWFLVLWVVMMAAMMLPSIAPTIALYSRMTKPRDPVMPLLFAAGYLITWAGAGLAAFLVDIAATHLPGDVLAWDHSGQQVAGVMLLTAAAYELSPLKNICLGRCRSPLGFLLGSWRDGRRGALQMGLRNGGWCVGCCWALMGSLFALGIMSVTWMAFVAGAIAFEKTLPWRRLATVSVAALLLTLGTLLLAAPRAIPALTIPGDARMHVMTP